MRSEIGSKAAKILLLGGVLILVIGFLLVRECAYGGGMGARYKTCQCRGIEWELYDRTAADGPRKTLCIGIIESRTCTQFMSGPVVDCPP